MVTCSNLSRAITPFKGSTDNFVQVNLFVGLTIINSFAVWSFFLSIIFSGKTNTNGKNLLSRAITPIKLIWYSGACNYYHDFPDRGLLLTKKLINQMFQVKIIPLYILNLRHHEMVEHYQNTENLFHKW